MRLALVGLLAIAGCYNPSVAPCFLACGANESCPDGLACNTQGRCAETPTTMCTNMPLDDGNQGDMVPPQMTTVDVLALTNTGMPEGNVRVIFATAAGDPISELVTDSNGHAVSEVPTGSSVTLVRMTGVSANATTYLDLWQDAHIVSRFAVAPGSRQVTMDWVPPPGITGAINYYPYSSCFSGSSFTTALNTGVNIPSRCTNADIMLLAVTGAGPVRFAVIPNVPPATTNVAITASMWRTVGNIETDLSNAVGSLELQYSGFATPELAYTTAFVSQNVPPSGQIPTTVFPTMLGTTAAVRSTITIAGGTYQQFYVERMPPNSVAFHRDMAMVRFPWMNSATLDVATKKITWDTIQNSAMSPLPNVSFVSLAFRRGSASHAWHIIGRGDRLEPVSADVGSFTVPDIPGTNAFEPIPGDTAISEEVHYFRVPVGTENGVREQLESNQGIGMVFEVPGVTSVSHAIAM